MAPDVPAPTPTDWPGRRPDHAAARAAVPPTLAWLRDEANLRPPAIARVVGVTSEALARWADGTWIPQSDEVPMAAALGAVHAQVCRRLPDAPARRRWWTHSRRELGWLAPAEVLRRGRVGEVLLLVTAAAPADDPDCEGGERAR